jgi:hypothetical protein
LADRGAAILSGIKSTLKRVWEKLPLTPEIEWYLIKRQTLKRRGRLRRLHHFLEGWLDEIKQVEFVSPVPKKKLLLFSMLPIWMKHSCVLASAFYGMGHEVTLAYLPHEDWFTEQSQYQLRLRNLQLNTSLSSVNGRFETISWYKYATRTVLPKKLHAQVVAVTERDYQYTHQVEEVDTKDPFFRMRKDCNLAVARAAFTWLSARKPDAVIVPNGLILEFGAVFEVAQYFEIPTITYEYGEQKDRIWLAQDQPVMFQDTSTMWTACEGQLFSEDQQKKIKELYASRQQAGLWQNFSRQWQDVPTQGGHAVRQALGLDQRPIVLLAANVIGDSLTLGRQVFSESMTEWIRRTLVYFKDKDQVQFVLRIHPGERYTDGPSVENIVRQMLPEVPTHFRIIAAKDPINTYDLIAAADLGMVYTTTVGMEMAMYGLPAVVVGLTHYRGKGFTHDPESWDAYFSTLDGALADISNVQLSKKQVERAWYYAYNFFFEYPRPFPWHLRHLADDLETWPISRVLTAEGMGEFVDTFRFLLGENVSWQELITDSVGEGMHVSG